MFSCIWFRFFGKVDDEFNFLKKSSAATFVRNWRKHEKNIFNQAKDILDTTPALKIIEKAEEAAERFGKIYFIRLF